jgi:endonuclease/exonuclease/phosphatase (EEP) superfamily protein YafD
VPIGWTGAAVSGMAFTFAVMSISRVPTAARVPPAARTGVLVVLWLLAAGCAVWALMRVFSLDRGGGPLVLLIAFTPYVAAGAVAVLVAAVLLRAWWVAAVAAVAAVALLACVLPRWLADAGNAGAGPRLRIMSANLLVGGADPGEIVELVRSHHVQLLALQEFTPDAERGLDAAGLARLLPNRVSYPQPGVEGSALYSSFPLRDDGLRTHPSGMTQAKATISVPGAPAVAVESAHPCAPTSPATAACWGTDIVGEPPATPDGEPRLLIGDFNATLDHARLRRLIATGYRDAADVRGDGFVPTWPFDRTLVPPVTIDHVLADRRIGVERYAVYRIPRSDHRAVFAELVLPP